MKISKSFFVNQALYILVLTLTVFLAYGQMLKAYFWVDGYSPIYFLLQDQVYSWPLHSLFFFVKLLEVIFGIKPWGYYAVGILLYLLATYLIFYFINLYFKKPLVAFIVSLVFASGYVGQEAFFSTTQLEFIGLNLFLLALITMFKYHIDGSNRMLFLSYLFCFLMLEFALYRFASAFLAFTIFDWGLTFKERGRINFSLLLRTLIFFLIFYVQVFVRPSYLFLSSLNFLLLPPVGQEMYMNSLFELPFFLNILQLESIARMLAFLWNSVFPKLYQTDLYFMVIRSFPSYIVNNWFWFSALPLFSFVQ